MIYSVPARLHFDMDERQEVFQNVCCRILENLHALIDAAKLRSWILTITIRECNHLIHEEQPYTFLYYQEEVAAYSKRFQNVTWWPLRPGYDLTSWFVPKGLQKYGTTPAP